MTRLNLSPGTRTWRKSSYSNANGGDCLEVGVHACTAVPVRDSKDIKRGQLAVPTTSWTALTTALKASQPPS
ncbi:DUF397 domain-containing protein [Yinghuangia sp. ASG 101]|nr:DUF397 domain-containing protein [Yinghuangia sp. ASG 101]UGQ14008.1 DUF397 domain-containing protein [Yinghuangia sp. ASG 101]